MRESGIISDMTNFELGKPALVCRWRLYRRRLPLANRHLRALLARRLDGEPVTKALVAWAKQHIEWTLEEGSGAYPDGVLALIVDQEGRAAMTVGPYEPLEDTMLAGLARRARKARDEAAATGVAPETLWVADGPRLLWNGEQAETESGATSLVVQLARTLGIEVARKDDLLDALRTGALMAQDAFLVSDEHGIVPAQDACGPHGTRMAQGYQRLLDSSRT